MNREEFKEEYLTDAFFFVDNRDMFMSLQRIGFEFGVKNPIGTDSFISYDLYDFLPDKFRKGLRVAENLTFFPDNRFQQSGFYVKGASYGEPKNYEQLMRDYKTLDGIGEQ